MRNLMASQYTSGFDCNASSETAEFKVIKAKRCGIYVSSASGTHATHVLTIYFAGDNNGSSGDFITSTKTLTGIGLIDVDISVSAYIKVVCTTQEGAASTVNILINTYEE